MYLLTFLSTFPLAWSKQGLFLHMHTLTISKMHNCQLIDILTSINDHALSCRSLFVQFRKWFDAPVVRKRKRSSLNSTQLRIIYLVTCSSLFRYSIFNHFPSWIALKISLHTWFITILLYSYRIFLPIFMFFFILYVLCLFENHQEKRCRNLLTPQYLSIFSLKISAHKGLFCSTNFNFAICADHLHKFYSVSLSSLSCCWR